VLAWSLCDRAMTQRGSGEVGHVFEDEVPRSNLAQQAKVLVDQVAAVSVGIVEDQLLLDLCYEEDSRAETDMNVVMTGSGGIVEVQGTAEGRPFTRAQAVELIDLAAIGIERLLAVQQSVLSALTRA